MREDKYLDYLAIGINNIRMVLKQPSQRARGLRPGLPRRGLGQCHHWRQVQHAVHPPQHGAQHHQKRQPADQRTRTPAAMG